MSIRVRSSGRFVVDYYPHGRAGKRVRVTLPDYVKNIETAKEIEKNLRAPAAHSEILSSSATVKETFPLYMSYCEMHRAARTTKDIEMVFRLYINEILGNYRVEEIGREHTTIYKSLRKEGGIKKRATNRTINKEMYYFMGFLKWCRKEHKLNVADFRYEPLDAKKHIPTVLSPVEAIEIIRNTDDFHRVFFLVLYFLGLRFSEATALRIEDLDISNKTIVVREGKGNKERLLPVSDFLIKELKKVIYKRKTGLIFISKKSASRVIDVRCAIKNSCKKAGIDKAVTPHSFRHTYATHLMGLGVNIKIIQLLLGHARESTTADMYTHGTIDHMRSAQAILEKQYNSVAKKDKAGI